MFDDNKQLRGGFLRNVVLLSGVGVAAWAQGAFVYQYDGMNETNRVEVTSVKVSGVNRTLTWKADREGGPRLPAVRRAGLSSAAS